MEPPPPKESSSWEKNYKARQYTLDEWENQRIVFTKLYLDEDRKLTEVRKIMAESHGFYATERQFKEKIKKWGLQKKIDAKTASAMIEIKDKRKSQDAKSTAFKFKGQPVYDKNLERSRKRQKIDGEFSGRNSPVATPPYVDYWTPRNDPRTPSDCGTPRGGDTPRAMIIEVPSPRPPSVQAQDINMDNTEHESSPFAYFSFSPLSYIPEEDSEHPLLESIAGINHSPRPQSPMSLDHPDQSIPNSLATRTEMRPLNLLSPLPILPASSASTDPPSTTGNTITPTMQVSNAPHHPSKMPLPNQHSTKEDRQEWVTALQPATSTVYGEQVQPLVEKNVGFSIPDKSGKTALHYAALKGDVMVVRLLLEAGVDTSALDKDGHTSLHLAVANRHVEVVQLLLEKGADISALDKDGDTPLHLAAFKGHAEMVQLLLENGADISTPSKIGVTPLHFAALNGHTEIVLLLLEKGADISALRKTGVTLLHLAALNGHAEIVQLLLEKGADISALDEDGITPLHLAAFDGHAEMVQLLLENGADISTPSKIGVTPLHFAALNGHAEIVQLLLEKVADISTLDENERTPLHFAALNGHAEIVQLLLKSGVDVAAVEGY